jgi:hypothetical protein
MNTKELSDYLRELKPSADAILDVMTAHALRLEEELERVKNDRDEILKGFDFYQESSHNYRNP